PYRERGSRRPDPMPRLQECIAAVAAHARGEIAPQTLILGGRSMGGRAASMLAADGFSCDGLLLLAYPLHPAGRPEELRDAHLAKIAVPVLCLNGTRDTLCARDPFHVTCIQGIEGRDAYAQCGAHGVARLEHRGFDARSNPFGKRFGALDAGSGENHAELLSAVAPGDVVKPERAAQQLGHPA